MKGHGLDRSLQENLFRYDNLFYRLVLYSLIQLLPIHISKINPVANVARCVPIFVTNLTMYFLLTKQITICMPPPHWSLLDSR